MQEEAILENSDHDASSADYFSGSTPTPSKGIFRYCSYCVSIPSKTVVQTSATKPMLPRFVTDDGDITAQP